MQACACKPEIAIGDARPTQKEHLEEPIEDDCELAEEERAEKIRSNQNIVKHEQRNRQHAHGAQDTEEIGQRCKSPLALIELKQPIDARRIEQETGQKQQQCVKALLKSRRIKPQPEAHDYCGGRRRNIVPNDQCLARRQLRHAAPRIPNLYLAVATASFTPTPSMQSSKAALTCAPTQHGATEHADTKDITPQPQHELKLTGIQQSHDGILNHK